MLTKVAKQPLNKLIASHFAKFYPDEEVCNTMSRMFVDQMKKKLHECSLNDIERIANTMFLEN